MKHRRWPRQGPRWESTSRTRTGLWGGVEEVAEREECEWTLGLGLRGKVRGGGAGTEVV